MLPLRPSPLARLVLLAALAVTGCAGPAAPVVPAEPAGLPPPFAVEAPPVWRVAGSRVAAFNAEFLFDGEGDEGQATFPWKGDPEAARAHRSRVGAVVRMLDADVVMLAEVENLVALERLAAEQLAGMGYTAHLVPGLDRFTRQNMGLLARVPIEATGRTDERAPVGTTDQTYGVSKNLWARLTLGGVPTTLVGVHFLARPDDAERRPQREAQAEVIRRLVVSEQAAGREVVVLGDVNDFDEATPDRAGSRPISSVLRLLKAAGDGPADDLRNALAEVPQAQRFTALYDRNDNGRVDEGELSAIDHVLLSPGLHRRLREVRYVHAHDPTLGPDHFPVVVTLGE